MYQLNVENNEDVWEVEALYDTCFAPGREALSSYRLRDGVERVSELCFVARDADGIVAAAIRFWPVHITQNHTTLSATQTDTKLSLLLGPIAVHPTRQGEGLGGLLMRESLRRATELGWQRVLLVGDAPYYARFGFQKLQAVQMPPPTNPDRVLGLSLQEGAWQDVSGFVTRAL